MTPTVTEPGLANPLRRPRSEPSGRLFLTNGSRAGTDFLTVSERLTELLIYPTPDNELAGATLPGSLDLSRSICSMIEKSVFNGQAPAFPRWILCPLRGLNGFVTFLISRNVKK